MNATDPITIHGQRQRFIRDARRYLHADHGTPIADMVERLKGMTDKEAQIHLENLRRLEVKN